MKKIILTILLTLITFNVNALEVKVKGNKLYLNGSIEKNDFYNIQPFITKNIKKVYLNSGGGYLHEAILIGYAINELNITTVIAKGQECASACGLIFLAGKKRQFDGLLGIHCSYIKDTEGCYQPGIDKMQRFLDEVAGIKISNFYIKNAQQREMKWFKK